MWNPDDIDPVSLDDSSDPAEAKQWQAGYAAGRADERAELMRWVLAMVKDVSSMQNDVAGDEDKFIKGFAQGWWECAEETTERLAALSPTNDKKP